MMLQWVTVVASLVVGVAAWVSARRTRRQLRELTAMYWQLKYEHGELKARVSPEPADSPPAPQAFVPISGIKRS